MREGKFDNMGGLEMVHDKMICSRCKGEFLHSESNTLRCMNCNTRYPIIKGVPTLLDYHIQNRYRKLYRDVNVKSNFSIYSRIFQNLDHHHIKVESNLRMQQSSFNSVATKLTLKLLSYYDLNEKDVLEVGCRKGETLHNLSRIFPKSQLYGLDMYLEEIIEANNKKSTENYICGDLYNLPIQKESFDVILSMSSLPSYHEPLTYLSECKRVLKSQGILMMADLFHCDQVNKITNFCEANGMKIIKIKDISKNVMNYLKIQKKKSVLNYMEQGVSTNNKNHIEDCDLEAKLYKKLMEEHFQYCFIWCQKK